MHYYSASRERDIKLNIQKAAAGSCTGVAHFSVPAYTTATDERLKYQTTLKKLSRPLSRQNHILVMVSLKSSKLTDSFNFVILDQVIYFKVIFRIIFIFKDLIQWKF